MTERMEVQLCTGSEMDGLHVLDLVEFAGLPMLDGEEERRVWWEMSPIQLLEDCYWADIIWQDEDDIEHIPRFTDRYFTVYTTDMEKLRAEVREAITARLNSSVSSP